MTALESRCPTGCGRGVLAGHLMCRTCWSEVPKDLQTDVYRTWRAYRRVAGNRRPNGKAEARQAYRAACDVAIGSVR